MAIVGLMPAAGHATRLAGAIQGSKEVQLVRGRPVMAYLMDRFRLGGADRVRVATRPEKRDVIALAVASGAEVVTGHPASVSASLLLAAEELADEDIALFGFPDTVWSPDDGFRALVSVVAHGAPIALGIFESPYPGRSDVATLDTDGRLVSVDVKPAAPTSSLVWASGAARVGVLREILHHEEPGVAFSRLAASGPVAAVRLGRVIDIGLPESWRAAESDPVFDGSAGSLTSGGTAARPGTRGPRAGPGPRPGH
jgi:hypothetical protein